VAFRASPAEDWSSHLEDRRLDGIVVMDRSHGVDASREDALDRAFASYEDVIRELQPVSWSISVDGEDTAGDYLLVEALNMGRIGPNFAPTFEADWSDGRLSVVTAS
jgi:hypothetical protein